MICDGSETEIWREDYPGRKPFAVSWAIRAPWAHPVWSEYIVSLYDLTSPTEPAPVIHLRGATHEFVLFAIAPDVPLRRDRPLVGQGFVRLNPPNYGYQFKAESDAAAQARIQAVMDRIAALEVSPDTDFRRFWNEHLFPDAHPLVRSIFRPMVH